MDEEQKNKQILKEAFDIWHETKGGSIEHWMGILGDSIKFKSLADGAKKLEFTNRVKSREEMERYFSGLTDEMEMIHYTVDHYVAEGDKVVAVGRTKWRVKASGKTFDTPKCDVVRFKDGKIISFYEYYDTAMVLDAAT